MVLLGVDPHKSTHTATAVEPSSNQQVASIGIEASLPEHRRLLAGARRWPQRTWAVENARGLGRHLAQWLIARGEKVVDVAASATSRVRELSRGGRRKNDQIDAAAAATVACLHGDGREVRAEDHTTALALLDERRMNLAQAGSAPSTNSTRCFASCCPVGRRLSCPRTRQPDSCGPSDRRCGRAGP
ncbi:IS110 family transposase [Streptomyces violascens]|uniref:IS110 family transposase n=1 Tax=Streptomyces violascens TaxID=67381 RepID=UPI0036BC3056